MPGLGLGIGLSKARAADPNPFPSSVSGLVLRLESDKGITLNGSDVDVWADQSGNSNDASAPAASNRPLYVENELNGEQVLRLDGSTEYLSLPNLLVDADTAITVFVVSKSDLDNVDSKTIEAQEANENHAFTVRYNNTSNGSVDFFLRGAGGSGGTVTHPTASSTSWNLIVGKGSEGGNVSIAVNGGSFTDGAAITTFDNFTTTNNTHIGSKHDATEHFLDGDIAAILVYNTALSDTDRDSVEVYLANKYGLPHPNATWVQALDGAEQAAVLSGSITRDEYNSTGVTSVMKLRLESDQGITLNGSDVDVWADQSGNSNDASAPVASNRPLYVENELNGEQVLRFDGANNYMENASTLGITNFPFTMFVVGKSNGSSSSEVFAGFSDADDTSRFANLRSNEGEAPDVIEAAVKDSVAASGDAATTYTLGTNVLVTGIYNSTTLRKVYLNGGSEGTNADSKTFHAGIDTFVIGNRTSGDVQPLDGDIAAILVYNTALSDTERQLVEDYLNTKYAIY